MCECCGHAAQPTITKITKPAKDAEETQPHPADPQPK